jgi:hypothetical protein
MRFLEDKTGLPERIYFILKAFDFLFSANLGDNPGLFNGYINRSDDPVAQNNGVISE